VRPGPQPETLFSLTGLPRRSPVRVALASGGAKTPVDDPKKGQHPLAPDSWFQIGWAIQRGEHPRQEDLIAALYRNERLTLPDAGGMQLPDGVQPYIAKLLDKKFDRRGRPGKSENRKLDEAYYLVRRVDRWGRYFLLRKKLRKWKQAAFEKVAAEHGCSASTIKGYYDEAKKLLVGWTFATCDWKHKKIMRRYESARRSGG